MAFQSPLGIPLGPCGTPKISSRKTLRLQCGLSRGNWPKKNVWSWRQFRSQLVASERRAHRSSVSHQHPLREIWAHELSSLEVGCCIVSTETSVWSLASAHYNKAVILVTKLDSTGITGILLTHPSRWNVSSHESILGRVGREFGDNVVFIGGDCECGTMEILHDRRELVGGGGGAQVVFDGLYRGGVNGCRDVVKNGNGDREAFRIFMGYTRFQWDKWRKQYEAGKWRIVACSERLILGRRRGLWNTIHHLVG